jgi:hypothetical protein
LLSKVNPMRRLHDGDLLVTVCPVRAARGDHG